MLTLDGLIQDIVQRRSKVQSKDGGNESPQDYAEVWSTFVTYVKSCLDQRRGLHLSSFCKIAWITTRSANKAQKPFFQFTDQFVRTYLSSEAARKASLPPPGELSAIEDFNFSKAAIKYSNQLTKDQVFTLLKIMCQRLGELIAEGKEVSIPFGDMGKLVCRGDRDPRFAFSPALAGSNEGLGGDATLNLSDQGAQRSAAAFSKHAPPEAQTLGISGNAGGGGYVQTQPIFNYQETREEVPEDVGFYNSEAEPPRGLETQRQGMQTSASAPSLAASNAGGLTSTQFKKELAYKEAMDRHIMAMEARAAEAVAEKDAWDNHVTDCLDQERDEIQSKKARNAMNLHFLQHQMAMGEEKRKEQRKEDIIAASLHEFPHFSEVHPNEMKDFVHGQQARVKKDLDDQVRTNNTLRNLAKQRERMLEVNQLEANRQEMAMLRHAERAKKAYDREALATAWNSEIRMKNIWKAIENHNKSTQKRPVGTPQVATLGDGLPPSRGGSTLSTGGRLLTGNSRKVPLGCSTSLSQLEARSGSGRGIQ
eukprot:TRINITY_DN10934_c0_g4_i1.p1 TRINITY_DN10934_c0_g4~~TRINITY_DN10934_c0_g4_i1.p1  ORF type:complete len:536 (+),score=127.51 TRINITY_DN10934_c0_g4_i1:99-1706(+)